jgi:hypothetical protein
MQLELQLKLQQETAGLSKTGAKALRQWKNALHMIWRHSETTVLYACNTVHI